MKLGFNIDDLSEDLSSSDFGIQKTGSNVGTITQEQMCHEEWIKKWAEVFHFEYDAEFNPVAPQPKLPKAAKGVYRPESIVKFLQPQPNPYRGMKDGRFQFYFEGPILSSCIKAQIHEPMRLISGEILQYPTYIYTPLKIVANPQADEVFMHAIHELDTLITMGDMNFTEANDYRGNSYQYGCPFFLSFLKTQVIIILANDTAISNCMDKESVIPVDNFGVYDPYCKVAGWPHPAIFLNLKAMRARAKKQKDLVELYQRTLLTLLTYAYQDPNNKVDEKGTFTKMSMGKLAQKNIPYDKDAAEKFVNSYLNLSH